MNPFQQAIMRIFMGHYGGNFQDPRVARWLNQLGHSTPGQGIANQAFIGQLGAGVMPRGYQQYGGHSIPGGSHTP